MNVNRLTKPYEIHNNEVISYVADASKYHDLRGYEQQQADIDAINKLGQLEDIEEELGIDLITLFKALKEGIYYKSFDGDIDYLSARVLTLSYSLGFDIWVTGHRKFDGLLIEFKDYGKIWGLTKEELQNE